MGQVLSQELREYYSIQFSNCSIAPMQDIIFLFTTALSMKDPKFKSLNEKYTSKQNLILNLTVISLLSSIVFFMFANFEGINIAFPSDFQVRNIRNAITIITLIAFLNFIVQNEKWKHRNRIQEKFFWYPPVNQYLRENRLVSPSIDYVDLKSKSSQIYKTLAKRVRKYKLSKEWLIDTSLSKYNRGTTLESQNNTSWNNFLEKQKLLLERTLMIFDIMVYLDIEISTLYQYRWKSSLTWEIPYEDLIESFMVETGLSFDEISFFR